MQFDSLGAALAMDGHGGYVWFVYVVATLVVLFLLLGPVLRSRRITAQQRRRWSREQVQANANANANAGVGHASTS